jgi:hypothetical protein
MINSGCLILKHLTENSNGFMTAKSIKNKLLSVIGPRISVSLVQKNRKIFLGKFLS